MTPSLSYDSKSESEVRELNPAADMSLLSTLSQYVLVPILSEWLYVLDFINLDSSVTSHIDRSSFLKMIRSYPLKFYSVCIPSGLVNVNVKLLLWLHDRNLKLLYVCIDARQLICSVDALSPLKNIKKAEISNFDSDTFRPTRPKLFIEGFLVHVVHLSISFTGFLSNVIDCLAQTCRHLKTLRLEMLESRMIAGKRVKYHGLINLCRSCHKLQTLDLPNCDVTVESLLSTIIVRCRHYSTLNMSNRRLIAMFLCHSRSSLTTFSCVNPSLKYLHCLLSVGTHRYSLTSLTLTHSEVLDNTLIRDITNLCPSLVALDLSHNIRATSICLVFVAIKYPSLTSFNMMGICFVDCNHLSVLTTSCRLLRELHFNDYYTAFYQLNQNGLLSIALNCPHLVSLTAVRSKLTESIMLEIVRHCPYLRVLNVTNNYLLTAAFFDTYCHFFKVFTSINVKGCMEKRSMEVLMSRHKLNLICV